MAEIDINGGVPATTLNGLINSSVTSITITSATGWPDGSAGDFYAVIDKGLSTQEVVQCTALAGSVLTVVRGVDGSTAAAHADGAAIEHIVPALTLQEANSHANATTGTPHGTAYLTSSTHASTTHTLSMMGANSIDSDQYVDGSIDNVHLAASGFDISKFTVGTSDRNTTGNAATATTAGNITTTTATFTPTATQGVSLSMSNNAAWYVQIGDTVFAWWRLTFSSAGTSGSDLEVSLPVTASDLRTIGGSATFLDASGVTQIGFTSGGSSTSVAKFYRADGSANNAVFGDDRAVASGDILLAHAIYEAA